MARSWEVVEHSAAPPERVWALLADARGWPSWARVPRADLAREGEPPPDGVGALRRFGMGRLRTTEEIVVFDAPRHLAYELRRGMPVVGYRADVTLEPDSGGTRITWASRMDRSTVPGGDAFFAWFLRSFIRDTARRLARAAERGDA